MNLPGALVAISLLLVLGSVATCAVVHPRVSDPSKPEVLR